MELNSKNVVVLRNGQRGIVMNWGDKPTYVGMARWYNPIGKWDNNGKYKGKDEYDIIAVHDGSEIENALDVFKASTKLENLPLIWSE